MVRGKLAECLCACACVLPWMCLAMCGSMQAGIHKPLPQVGIAEHLRCQFHIRPETIPNDAAFIRQLHEVASAMELAGGCAAGTASDAAARPAGELHTRTVMPSGAMGHLCRFNHAHLTHDLIGVGSYPAVVHQGRAAIHDAHCHMCWVLLRHARQG